MLPEELCLRLTELADSESRTVSNMAMVLIKQGLERLQRPDTGSDRFRQSLERQPTRRLRGAPRRLRFYRPLR